MVIFYYVSFPARVVSEFTQVKFPTQSEGKPIPKRQVENTKAAQQLAELIFKSVVDPPPGFCFSRMRLSGDSVPLRSSSLGSQHCPKVPLPWSRRVISFRIDWLDLLAVQGTLKGLLQHQFKSINSSALSFLYSPTVIRSGAHV